MWRRLISGLSGPGSGEEPPPEWVWPVRLSGRTSTGARFLLRPLAVSDGPAFQEVRRVNRHWLEPWDATSPDPDAPPRAFGDLVRQYDRDAAAARMLPLAIEVAGGLVGQVNVGTLVFGSFRSCAVGYWISRTWAGQKIVPTAVALVGDHLLGAVGLHRMEINIRPENTASLAVVRDLGFRDEGVREHYLHIDGAWRRHRAFALTVEDLSGETMTARLGRLAREAQSSQQPLPRHTDAGAGSAQ